ncbi:hypothetical protein [Mucilaginibacter sp.]|uniref:hypothetical protein n=1 Tax=Mucilaginibacter sp. TaxID=1882438 RepID=UPI003263B73E
MATDDEILNLLVPIHLEAIVVNGNNNYWKSTAQDLTALNAARYKSSAALGFYLEKRIDEAGKKTDDNQPVLEKGIHLHWIMPDALRKGKHLAHGELDFPAVPNRWLIVRTDDSGAWRAWVLQSDFLQPDNPIACNYIKEDAVENTIKPIVMGKAWNLIDWKEDGTQTAIDKLTIIAPGNSEFAASYVHCKNIFGFRDDMKDAAGNLLPAGASFTYQVSGWYANKTQDPLSGVSDNESLQAKLKELSWALEGDAAMGARIPTGTVCYAMVHSIPWVSNPQKSIPPASSIQIGIGNTTSEALASLLHSQVQPANDYLRKKLLATFQFKSLLDNGLEGNGLDILNKKMHAKTFLPVEAGVVWVVQPPEREPGDNRVDKSLDPFDGEVSAQLLKLNDLQGDYNKIADKLASQQAELYALNFKKKFSGTRDSGQGSYIAQWPAILAKLDKDIPACVTAVNSLNQQLGALLRRPLSMHLDKPDIEPQWPKDYVGKIVMQYQKLLDAMERAKMAGYEAKRIAAPQYYEPVDPAVVITGLIPSPVYLKGPAHNLQSQNADDGKLKCRTKYVVANRLYNGSQKIGAELIFARSMGPIYAMIDRKNIPAGIKDLVIESLVTNPLMKTGIATASSWKPEVVEKLLNDMDPKCFKRVEKVVGKEEAEVDACLPPADARAKWKQPWNPLYLEWGVSWQPESDPTRADVLSGWKFGGKNNRIDFNSGPSLKNSQGVATTYYGRTLLSFQFAGKVKALNDTIKQLFNLEASNPKMFNEFSPMSQSLGGFGSQLIQRYNGVQLPMVNVKGDKLMVDDSHYLMGNQNSWQPKIVDWPFTPVRAGIIKVNMLRVIDSFGQVLNAYPADTLLGAKKKAFKHSAGMQVAGVVNEFKLGPRIIQPARLRFDWLSATEPTRVTDSDPGTSPVCGWLLYNALDKNLVVYRASGQEVGYFVKRASDKTVQLLTIPGSNAASGLIGLPNLNPTLLSIMNFIRENPANFDGICNQIDTVTKRIQAKYSRQQLTMALPTGFPIAILNARFLIELKGPAARDQSWIGGLEDKKFEPIRYMPAIGSAATTTDGLVGYFVNENYKRFMVSNGEKNVPLKFKSAPEDKFFTEQTQKLTILMDPRTMVTLTTGLLPMGTYELPQHTIKKALKKINVRVLAAPVLTPVSLLKMPLYKGNDADWDFVSPLKAKPPLVAEEATSPLNFEEVKATEGWLTLVSKNPENE